MLPLLVGLSCALTAADALAAPPGPGVAPLHVLELATDDMDDQAKALTLALRARVRASKDYSLADGDYALGVFLAQLKCGDVPDATCQGKIADNLKTERYVWGTMRKAASGQVTADVHLWQRGQQDIRQQISFSDNMTVAEDPNLQKLADQVLNKLVNFGKVGTVKLSGPQNLEGDLFIDGQGQGKFSLGATELTLPVGDHQFEVRSGGNVVAKGAGKVSPGAVEIELTPVKTETVAITTTQAGWKKPAAYAAIGVGGVMILAAGYMTIWGATGGFGNDDVKNFGTQHVAKGDDVCDVARNPGKAFNFNEFQNGQLRSDVVKTCDRGDTFRTAQFVLYPVGALLAAGGGYLLYSSKEKGTEGAAAKRRVQVTPMVGQQGGFVDLRVAFLKSMLRIVAGRLGGRRLVAPRDSATRPTSEKVREAIFAILGEAGEPVLDLYAGSGALGFEALSRGAERVVFVESRRPALDALRDNIAALGVAGSVEVIPKPVERVATALASFGPFSLIVADPPYALVDDGQATRAIEAILAAGLLAPGGSLVLEHASRTAPPSLVGLDLDDSRRYGDTAVSFFSPG